MTEAGADELEEPAVADAGAAAAGAALEFDLRTTGKSHINDSV
jgi:hypothetical protein